MLIQYSAGYVLNGIIPAHLEEAFFRLIAVMNKILEATSDVELGEEHDADPVMKALKLEEVLALVAVEESFPGTDVGPIVFHIIPHVVGCV